MVLLVLLVGIANAFIPLMNFTPNGSDAAIFGKLSSSLFSASLVTVLFLAIAFPYDFAIIASPVRRRTFFTIYILLVAIFGSIAFLISNVDYWESEFWFSRESTLYLFGLAIVILPSSVAADLIFYRSAESHRGAAVIIGTGLALFLILSIIYASLGGGPNFWVLINIGMLLFTGVISIIFLSNRLRLVSPMPEVKSIGTKSTYRLLDGRVYLVEEDRPKFAFEIFTEILRSRCFDCQNDESFVCESLDCSACGLPCPCRECTQHKSRTQGLVITRRHPTEIRMKYLIQTTPIIWLTSIPGKENIDPSKLSLLTDMIINFIEKSQNGVVLIEGLEYLVTANDFNKVLRAVDRWSEVVMANSSRLVMSVNPKAFDAKELALMERNREIVSMRDKMSVEKIMATSST
ncbi:MAG: DUF835 domain-containing protein [Thermoplasmata archaeon]|nr:DUF835 domain-containing protein [Thermoplasmata archaeon]